MGQHINTSRIRKCHICGIEGLPPKRSKCSPCNQQYQREYRALRSARIQDLEDEVTKLRKEIEWHTTPCYCCRESGAATTGCSDGCRCNKGEESE